LKEDEYYWERHNENYPVGEADCGDEFLDDEQYCEQESGEDQGHQ
jgi:hypothetical protein